MQVGQNCERELCCHTSQFYNPQVPIFYDIRLPNKDFTVEDVKNFVGKLPFEIVNIDWCHSL